jgi:putative transposase
MRGKRATQSLSSPIRLPDWVQADALRLLDVSRQVINATVVALWMNLGRGTPSMPTNRSQP